MVIRPYNDSDREAIVELLRLNTPEYFSRDEHNDLTDYLEEHLEYYYVVVVDDAILGCGGINLSQDGKTAMLSWDIVQPEYHGKGIGSALMKFRIQQIEKIAGVVTLSVRTSQLVYKFYEKFGLELREIVTDYWATGFDMYRLDCELTSALDQITQ